MKKVLFTTTYCNSDRELFDYWRTNTRSNFFRYTWIRRHSMGLRFLKVNIPEIEILEYPTWQGYTDKINSGQYNIVGFSFYINETPYIIKMIEYARKSGVKTVWGGNYGVLTPEVQQYFDKVFIGYAEDEVAKELGVVIDRLKHPLAITYLGTPIGLKFIKQGILHTTRGCPLNCKFCQTPVFAPKIETIPLESIEEAIIKYKKLNVTEMYILDENFGILKNHADEVASLLHKYNMHWYPQTRADILQANLDRWIKQGLAAANLGIESLSQKILDLIDKRLNSQLMIDLINRMNRCNLVTILFYVIGLEHETRQSIMQDMKKLAALDSDIYQISILTPVPGTQLEKDIKEDFGIINKDYRDYDTKHLVWKHPNLAPEDIADFLTRCYKTLYSPKRFFRTLGKAWSRYVKEFGFLSAIKFAMKSLFSANVSYYIKKDHRHIDI